MSRPLRRVSDDGRLGASEPDATGGRPAQTAAAVIAGSTEWARRFRSDRFAVDV